jgi:hypothetical protein
VASDRFAIAQVAPHPLEDAHEVGTFAREVSRELAERGHRVLLLGPSRSPELVRESRRLIRAAREQPDSIFDPDGGVRVLGVGELLFNARRKGVNPAPPLDIARTIEEALSNAPLDFVHVHEPWAPSAGSVALRHSRALNVGSFHQPAERVLSTQVARLRGPEAVRRGHHLRPDAADQLARARPDPPGGQHDLAGPGAAEGAARRARVHDLTSAFSAWATASRLAPASSAFTAVLRALVTSSKVFFSCFA